MKIRLPFKTRRLLRDENENLKEQLRIATDERRKEAAKCRSAQKALSDFVDKIEVLKAEKKDLEEKKAAVERAMAEQLLDYKKLEDELKGTKDINAGLSSTVTDLKQRNSKLAEKIRKLEEQSNTYVAKKKGARQ